MSWFAPKVLKSDYDKVVADNMELRIELESLKLSMKQPQAIEKQVENSKGVKKLSVDYKWNSHFSPKDLVEFVIESLVHQEDIKKVGNSYYKKGEKIRVAEVLYDGRIKVTQKFFVEKFNDLSYRDRETTLIRMPNGTLKHLYNEGLIELAEMKHIYATFNFPINTNIAAYKLTKQASKMLNDIEKTKNSTP